jgi:wyosine [tRNA(Phe)-imidazoG37] synthetase (radical SAM superfamily)
MPGFLFDDLVFGPIHSRRLGKSLGINLLPTYSKHCTFNCIYCECGWTKSRRALKIELPDRAEVILALRTKLLELAGTNQEPDSLTFAGNGEPTMHPDFAAIVDDVIRLRDEILPDAKVSVLSNGSMVHHFEISEALMKVDNNILKLDGGNEAVIKSINLPLKAFRLKEYVGHLKRMRANLIIQTLFLRGQLNGKDVDNTKPTEVNDWLKLIVDIKPQAVMLYSLDRETPALGLEKVSETELMQIAEKVRAQGIEANVFG